MATIDLTSDAFEETVLGDGIVLVEWGDVVDLFGDHLVIALRSALDDVDDDVDVLALDGARSIDVAAVGATWAGRWDRLTRALEAYRC